MPSLVLNPRRKFLFDVLAAAGLALGLGFSSARADTPAWIAKSNENTQVLLDATSKFSPESASQNGLEAYDTQVSDLLPGINERSRAALVAAREELARRAAVETDPLVRQDLDILIKAVADQIESDDLNNKLLLPYIDVGRLIFYGELGLLDDQIAAKRRPSALARLKRYAGLEPGTTPITELAKARYADVSADSKLIGPYKAEVEKNLASTPSYISGIRDLYGKYGLDKSPDAAPALAALEKQLNDYNDWIRATILPRARSDFRSPAEIYADNLKQIGLDIPPEELIHRALASYAEIRNELQALAPLVAKERGLKDSNYVSVIRALKKEQLGKDQVEPWYHEVLGQIEGIIRKERIVTLPERAMAMRLASEAENAGLPAPHMQPPALANNTGERGTFVLATGNPSGGASQTFDDFTFKAAAWTLTAHEGRPGHELQFAAMVERGVSLARSLYAFNSVNVEGWALYSEAEMKPYEPLDGQLITLQMRLQRAARAFLDPMLNLGLITPERAHDILTQEVGLSGSNATVEVERYTFRLPGQATAYFYGYMKLMELRAATEVTLGPKFDRMAFNDFIVGQGLLPPNLLAKAVREQFIPAQAKK